MPASDPFGPWAPLSFAQTRGLFEHARFTWWVAGGQALDLYVGRQTREPAGATPTSNFPCPMSSRAPPTAGRTWRPRSNSS
jgi:hypothetical protein